MFSKMRAWALVVVSVTMVWGCDSAGSPSGPFTGTWTGMVSDNLHGPGTLRLVLEQDGLAVRGTLQTTFSGVVNRDGPVAGTVIAGGTMASLSQATGRTIVCANGMPVGDTITMTVTLAGGRLNGSYLGFTCEALTSGRFDLGPVP